MSGKVVEFRVDAPLLGYRASAARVFERGPWSKVPKYKAFKERVYLLALQAGFPGGHEVDPEHPPRLSVSIYWKGKPRVDWKNVVGALEDSLWRQDRYVVPGEFSVCYGCGEEYAIVRICFDEGDRRCS